jgi:endonuclease-8
MPEGHTIHRAARLHSELFVGEALAVTSPQGRFTDGATVLDGHQLDAVEAWGKHLFYRWRHGPILHIHLGLFGRFRHFSGNPSPPTPGTRLAIVGRSATLYLAGPTECEIIEEVDFDQIVHRLGPDPLRNQPRAEAIEHIIERLSRRHIPIGAALLDQSVIAGLGNVYRAEILYRLGIDPNTVANQISGEQVAAIWDESIRQLRLGEQSGRIITTDPVDVGRRRRADIHRDERTYVYHRSGEPCRRCRTPVQRLEMKGRKIWWCPSCQT